MRRDETNNVRVLMVSTSYPADKFDWKGRFIADMATAISQKNICLFMWSPPGELPPGVVYDVLSQDQALLARLLRQGGIAHLLRTHPFHGLAAARILLKRLANVYTRARADIIHINWLQNALPLGKSKTPALVTVLGSDYHLLKIPGMIYFIRKVLAGRPVIIAPNASWMAPILVKHFGNIAEIRPIPFGVDKRWFGIQRQPQAKKWIAITRITKGKIGDLFAWGANAFNKGRELHLFGPMQEKLGLPDWVIWHGPTHPDELAEKWFPHATGLITLSRHSEGRPQVLLEAMAAGLPVVVSDLPAHTDVVSHGKTGWIANSPTSLIHSLEQAENLSINAQVGKSARSHIRETIGDWDDCAERYVTAYQDLMAKQHVA